MTTWQLIRSMIQKGYEFQVGPHANGLRGYWAYFIEIESDERAVCDECSEKSTVCWAESGHAMTAHRAVVMAAKVALGKQVVVPGTGAFE